MNHHTANVRSQSGISSLNLMIVLLVAGFFMMCAFKLVPAYAENMYVVDALKALGDGAKPVGQMSKKEIKSTLQRHYMLNNVRTEGPNNIDVERTRDGLLVNINYEVRTTLIDAINLDVVVSFENQLDSTDIDSCCEPTKPVTKKNDKY